MITQNHRLKDIKKDAEAYERLKGYTSITAVRRALWPLGPFKLSTLTKVQRDVFGNMHSFLNGEPNPFPEGHPRRTPLWDGPVPLDDGREKPYLVSYYLDTDAPAVLIVPGGGYTAVAIHHEGQLIAEALNALGYHAVVLRYRVSPNRYPASHLDIIRAMQIIRAGAAEHKVISDRVYAMGFSAGGHLVSSMPGLYRELVSQTGTLKDIPAIPDGLILGYPLISLEYKVVGVSAGIFLLGSGYDKALASKVSSEHLVNDGYPPVYQWAMKHDPVVNVDDNCHLMKKALDEHNIPNQLHIFPGELHGTGLSNGMKAEAWFNESLNFIEKIKKANRK